MDTCAFCGEDIRVDQQFRNVPIGPDSSIAEPMHDEPRLCALRYEFSMLASRLDSATRKGTLDRPAAPISRVEFNKTYSGELLMLLQKWDRNEGAREKYEAARTLVGNVSGHGHDALVHRFGSAAEMNEFALKAELDRRAASDELERAVMVASDALYDAVFGKGAE